MQFLQRGEHMPPVLPWLRPWGNINTGNYLYHGESKSSVNTWGIYNHDHEVRGANPGGMGDIHPPKDFDPSPQ